MRKNPKNEEEPKSVRTARYVIEDIGVSSLMISKSLKYRGSEFSKTILKMIFSLHHDSDEYREDPQATRKAVCKYGTFTLNMNERLPTGSDCAIHHFAEISAFARLRPTPSNQLSVDSTFLW